MEKVSVWILAHCLMPHHWHMMLYPRVEGDLANFLPRIILTHTQRFHSYTRSAGTPEHGRDARPKLCFPSLKVDRDRRTHQPSRAG